METTHADLQDVGDQSSLPGEVDQPVFEDIVEPAEVQRLPSTSETQSSFAAEEPEHGSNVREPLDVTDNETELIDAVEPNPVSVERGDVAQTLEEVPEDVGSREIDPAGEIESSVIVISPTTNEILDGSGADDPAEPARAEEINQLLPKTGEAGDSGGNRIDIKARGADFGNEDDLRERLSQNIQAFRGQLDHIKYITSGGDPTQDADFTLRYRDGVPEFRIGTDARPDKKGFLVTMPVHYEPEHGGRSIPNQAETLMAAARIDPNDADLQRAVAYDEASLTLIREDAGTALDGLGPDEWNKIAFGFSMSHLQRSVDVLTEHGFIIGTGPNTVRWDDTRGRLVITDFKKVGDDCDDVFNHDFWANDFNMMAADIVRQCPDEGLSPLIIESASRWQAPRVNQPVQKATIYLPKLLLAAEQKLQEPTADSADDVSGHNIGDIDGTGSGENTADLPVFYVAPHVLRAPEDQTPEEIARAYGEHRRQKKQLRPGLTKTALNASILHDLALSTASGTVSERLELLGTAREAYDQISNILSESGRLAPEYQKTRWSRQGINIISFNDSFRASLFARATLPFSVARIEGRKPTPEEDHQVYSNLAEVINRLNAGLPKSQSERMATIKKGHHAAYIGALNEAVSIAISDRPLMDNSPEDSTGSLHIVPASELYRTRGGADALELLVSHERDYYGRDIDWKLSSDKTGEDSIKVATLIQDAAVELGLLGPGVTGDMPSAHKLLIEMGDLIVAEASGEQLNPVQLAWLNRTQVMIANKLGEKNDQYIPAVRQLGLVPRFQ